MSYLRRKYVVTPTCRALKHELSKKKVCCDCCDSHVQIDNVATQITRLD